MKIKRFDPKASTQRMVNVLQKKSNWNHLQEDGATIQVLETLAESFAEDARYGEYLLQELKWDTARNFSSAKHMARLVGKKLERKHSAIGSVIISHSDLDGKPRFSFLGKSNFSLDSLSDYDDGVKNPNLNKTSHTTALTPWLSISPYTIEKGSIFTSNSGIEFVAAKTMSIQKWEKTWTSISLSDLLYKTFKADGGWNNYKYLVMPVVQGIQKEVEIGVSTGEGAQTFTLATLDIEAADSYYSAPFLYMEVFDANGDPVIWNEVDHLGTEGTVAKVFEIEIKDDMSGTVIKFGDGLHGAIPPKDSRLVLHYLETKGEDGNIQESYAFRNEIAGVELPTDTGYFNLSVGAQNVWPITGGTSLETLNEFKLNAETAYSKNYKILHTFTELEEKINRYSPIPLFKVKTFTDFQSRMVNNTIIWQPFIGITGLSASMNPLNNLEKRLFENQLNYALNDKVLSNKKITYIDPSILEFDCDVEIGTKTPEKDLENFSATIKTRLDSVLGKGANRTLTAYHQTDVIKEILDFASNVGFVRTTTLFTKNHSKILFGTNYEETPLFLIEFDIQNAFMDVLSAEGKMAKEIDDGNTTCAVFNVNLLGNAFTFTVSNKKTTEENITTFFSIDNFFEDEVANKGYWDASDRIGKYSLHQLNKEKHTFNRTELSNEKSFVYKEPKDFNFTGFFFKNLESSIKAYLLLDVESVATFLGDSFTKGSNIFDIYQILQTSIDLRESSFSLSIEPADQVVTFPEASILYYNNFTVSSSN